MGAAGQGGKVFSSTDARRTFLEVLVGKTAETMDDSSVLSNSDFSDELV